MKAGLEKLSIVGLTLLVSSLANAATLICSSKDSFSNEGAILLKLEEDQISSSLELSIFKDKNRLTPQANPNQSRIESYEAMLKRPDLPAGYPEIINKEIQKLKASSQEAQPDIFSRTESVVSSTDSVIEFSSDDEALARMFAPTRKSVVNSLRISVIDARGVSPQLRIFATTKENVSADLTFPCVTH